MRDMLEYHYTRLKRMGDFSVWEQKTKIKYG